MDECDLCDLLSVEWCLSASVKRHCPMSRPDVLEKVVVPQVCREQLVLSVSLWDIAVLMTFLCELLMDLLAMQSTSVIVETVKCQRSPCSGSVDQF